MNLHTATLFTYIVIAASTIGLIAGWSRVTRRVPAAYPHRARGGMYEAAFLSGGPGRVVDAALAEMHAAGELRIGGPGIVAVLRAEGGGTVERAILDQLAAAPNGSLNELRHAVMRSPAVQKIGDRLAEEGLLLRPGTPWRPFRIWGITQGVVCIVAIPAAIALTIVGLVHDWEGNLPPFVLTVLPALLVGSVSGFIMAGRARRLTATGRAVLQKHRSASRHVTGTGELVALRGPWRGMMSDPSAASALAAAAVAPVILASVPDGGPGCDAGASWCGTGPGSGGCGTSGGGGSSCGGGGSGGGFGCGGGGGSSGGSSCGGGGGGSSCGGGGGGSSCGGGGGGGCGGGGC